MSFGHGHENDHFDGYAGAAELTVGETPLRVEVTMRGFFHPADGRYQWYGRVVSDDLAELVGSRKSQVSIRTEHGSASATVWEPDLWGRYRIRGFGMPPFEISGIADEEN
ncbi:DUF4873 domain-containing protein [Nocardia nova]|uniref:DUF4873 domain-containing protein n=1 Tax=Nocardia nova SH22a TaxID=1415166 RepID=W5T8D9_9NOCA|nr:DUF4873 domain-containing protein [Nocardia nova]AHH15457.1 hypothetical protein NONO_c06450 [Nocardia nova SH22a]